MNITVLAHILNEEILLPSWLTHHRKLFTHGIIMDCGSTDRSIEIIQEYCPTWTIIRLLQHETANGIVDIANVEYIETKIHGWKCALNVSEYLIIDDLQKYISEFEQKNPTKLGFRVTGVIIVDHPDEACSLKDYSTTDLITRKSYGYLEKGRSWNGQTDNGTYPISSEVYRSRLIHKNTTGQYTSGIHNTKLDVDIMDDIYIYWIGRGSPLLYANKCSSWKNPPSGNALFDRAYYSKMSDISIITDFWKAELWKCSNIFDTIKNYKNYIDVLYNNN
jgi:hypothetical protein